MWQRLKGLLKRPRGIARRAKAKPGAADVAVEPQSGNRKGATTAAPVVFRRYAQYPNLFAFNLEKLDINLLMYPETGPDADRDAVLLIVFGCEEILALDDVNEAYVCRKLGQAKGSMERTPRDSFDAVYAKTARFNAQDIVDTCVRGGELTRLSTEAGGSVRLTPYARGTAAEMAFDLNRKA